MPGSEVEAEVVECAAGFPQVVTEATFPDPHLVFDATIAFDAADGVLNADAYA